MDPWNYDQRTLLYLSLQFLYERLSDLDIGCEIINCTHHQESISIAYSETASSGINVDQSKSVTWLLQFVMTEDRTNWLIVQRPANLAVRLQFQIAFTFQLR